MPDIQSRKVRGYLKLDAESFELHKAAKRALADLVAKREQLTGTQIAEAVRWIKEGNPYLAVVKVRTRERIDHAN